MLSPREQLLDELKRVLAEDRVSQRVLAAGCKVSQAHISRVLRKKSPLSESLEVRLRGWLTRRRGLDDELESLATAVRVLGESSPELGIHLMHLVDALNKSVARDKT